MQKRLITTLFVTCLMAITACGPKPPDKDQVKQLLVEYLRRENVDQYQVVDLKITDISVQSASCSVFFDGVFKPTESAKSLAGTFIGKLISKTGDSLEHELLSHSGEQTVSALMMLELDGKTWRLSKLPVMLRKP